MLTRLLASPRVTCGMCGSRFVPGLGYGPVGTSACSARCRRLQLSVKALPHASGFGPGTSGRRTLGTLWY